VSGSGISWAVCKSAPRSRQITTPASHHLVLYRSDALPATQPSWTNSVKALKGCITITHTHTQPFNGLWSGTTRVGQYQKKHSPIHTHPDHRTSFINFLHLLRSIASSVSVYVLDSTLWQPLSRSSLVFLLVLDPILYTPLIFSPNHHLLYNN